MTVSELASRGMGALLPEWMLLPDVAGRGSAEAGSLDDCSDSGSADFASGPDSGKYVLRSPGVMLLSLFSQTELRLASVSWSAARDFREVAVD